jgi:hypothetical protein
MKSFIQIMILFSQNYVMDGTVLYLSTFQNYVLIIWVVPFEITHGLTLMVSDSLIFFVCYTLTIVMNNV